MKPILLIILLFTVASCGTAGKSKRAPERVVPVEFNIGIPNRSSDLNFVNIDYYRLKVLDQLENFQSVDFTLAEPEEEAEVVIDFNIDNFILWPRDERRSRRTLSRVVQTGTDAAGKPIYQTVRATVDLVQVQRRSNARILVDLQVKGTPGKKFKRSFAPNYNYSVTYVDNIQGDPRAVDPSLYFARNSGMEPEAMDFLFQLSGEAVQRISTELRSYYRK